MTVEFRRSPLITNPSATAPHARSPADLAKPKVDSHLRSAAELADAALRAGRAASAADQLELVRALTALARNDGVTGELLGVISRGCEDGASPRVRSRSFPQNDHQPWVVVGDQLCGGRVEGRSEGRGRKSGARAARHVVPN